MLKGQKVHAAASLNLRGVYDPRLGGHWQTPREACTAAITDFMPDTQPRVGQPLSASWRMAILKLLQQAGAAHRPLERIYSLGH